MLKSRLNYQVCFCELIDKLNDNGCISVIRLLQQTMKCNDLNALLIKILNNLSQQFPTDALPDICNKIAKIVEDESCRKQSRETIVRITHNVNVDVLFPLVELPDDLIYKTSLYLNGNDIFQFEKCCRSFYQMINNTKYLNQTNNFKTFTITDKKLNQMANTKYSFFKYIKAQTLIFDFDSGYNCNDDEELINAFITELHHKWDKAKMIMNVDNLYENIFKSIKSIILDDDGSLLLGKLPINILFDSKISNLESIDVDHYWNAGNKKYLTKCLKNFESQYLQLKEKLDQHGEEIQKLKLLKATDVNQSFTTVIGPKHIIVNHLYLDNVEVDFFGYFYHQILKRNDNSINSVQILTIACNFLLDGDSLFVSWAKEHSSKCCIETLRIVDLNEDCCMDILNDKKIIESINLQNSLKNLTIHVSIQNNELVYKEIENVFNKEYFHKLENVNILFDIICTQYDTIIPDIFSFLKENRTTLEYQFKQLNIGLSGDFCDSDITYHTFEWNTSINDQFLDKQCNICCQTEQMASDKLAHNQKFNQWKNQWV